MMLSTTHLVSQLASLLNDLKLQLVTAESCTGGGLGFYLTSVSGSSDWYERGYITYSNRSKIELLGVKQKTLAKFGAVSEETALEMAEGALAKSAANISVAITGVAGPLGSEQKPPGLVWIAYASQQQFPSQAEVLHLTGDRAAVRHQTIESALSKLIQLLQK